jgi:hypothetical protein
VILGIFSYYLLIRFLDLHEALRIVSQERNEFHAHGRRALEVVFFGYEGLLRKLGKGMSLQGVGRWVGQEQDRLRGELLEFPRVDQFGVLLQDPEEEEEEEEKSAGVEQKAEGSRKGKEVARDQ